MVGKSQPSTPSVIEIFEDSDLDALRGSSEAIGLGISMNTDTRLFRSSLRSSDVTPAIKQYFNCLKAPFSATSSSQAIISLSPEHSKASLTVSVLGMSKNLSAVSIFEIPEFPSPTKVNHDKQPTVSFSRPFMRLDREENIAPDLDINSPPISPKTLRGPIEDDAISSLALLFDETVILPPSASEQPLTTTPPPPSLPPQISSKNMEAQHSSSSKHASSRPIDRASAVTVAQIHRAPPPNEQ
jgi:hypothetical protein